MSTRTAPYAAPEGWHYEAAPSEHWVTPAVGTGRCRAGAGPYHPACGQPAVATLWRRQWNGRAHAWDYCEQHLYGHWIEDGQVLSWHLREDA